MKKKRKNKKMQKKRTGKKTSKNSCFASDCRERKSPAHLLRTKCEIAIPHMQVSRCQTVGFNITIPGG